MLKKMLIFSVGVLIGTFCFCDQALIQIDANGRPIALPIPNAQPTGPTPVQITPTPPPPPTAKSATDMGSLPPAPNPGYIYYTLPGGVNLVTPWSAAIAAEGYDFIGKESITQGYLPLASWWKITGLIGAGINGKGEGSPLGGGMISIADVALGPNAAFHFALTGGYNLNERHALAVASGSIQFLK